MLALVILLLVWAAESKKIDGSQKRILLGSRTTSEDSAYVRSKLLAPLAYSLPYWVSGFRRHVDHGNQ